MSPPKPASPRLLVALGDKRWQHGVWWTKLKANNRRCHFSSPSFIALRRACDFPPPLLEFSPAIPFKIEFSPHQPSTAKPPHLTLRLGLGIRTTAAAAAAAAGGGGGGTVVAAGTDSAILVLTKWSRACHRRAVLSLVLGRNRTRQSFRALALELLFQDHAARGSLMRSSTMRRNGPESLADGASREKQTRRNQHQGMPHHDMLPFCEELARRIPTPHCATLDGEKADLSPPFPPLRMRPFHPVKHCERVLPNLPQRSLEPLIRKDPESFLAFAESRDEVQIPFPPASDGRRCTGTWHMEVLSYCFWRRLPRGFTSDACASASASPRKDKHQVKQAAGC
ncbi:hypothetical protein CFIO01_08497 [Colletotrichum fioriniae PJ7]|uniref:Uncharacterized protein n=1 Tax=Colletotrichum fioriniae PJ7 TaxID=1445577 RepID=A0A010QPW8_9PEZI|nr:hypothetical protein CFIO01_08497 [Colletotrichum fioriniae PJ7]